MPKRFSKGWRPKDVNQLAHHLVRLSTENKPDQTDQPPKLKQAEISRVMAAMGRRGGKIGGKRRMVTMTSEERREIALKAAKKRWENERKAS